MPVLVSASRRGPWSRRRIPSSGALAKLTGAWAIAWLAFRCAPGDRLEVGYAAEMLRRLSTAMPGRMVAFRPGEPPVRVAAKAADAGALWPGLASRTIRRL